MARQATGVDVGLSAVRAMTLRAARGGIQVAHFAAVARSESATAELGRRIPSLRKAVVGLTGRDMILRYTQVPPVPDWQLKSLMELEIQDIKAQSGGDLAADFNLLPRAAPDGNDTVLLALAREAALEERRAMVEGAGGTVGAYTPNPVALYNAYLRFGEVGDDEVVLLANMGHTSCDLSLVKGTDLLFARNVGVGGKVLDDALVAAFNVSARKASSIKRDFLDLDPSSRGRYASSQAEKVSQACLGAAGQLAASLQSTLAFCKAQAKLEDLRLDRVLLCGGTARVKGLKAYLRESLGCTVENFDPFGALDLSALDPDAASDLDRNRLEAVVALGLALGPLDPALYSIEILPEQVRRRRQFAERTVYLLAAGVLASGFLVWEGFTRKEHAALAARQASQVDGIRRRVLADDREADRLIEENRRMRTTLAALQDRAVPLHGSVQVLRVLGEDLPQDFWIRQLAAPLKAVDQAPGTGATPRPPGVAPGPSRLRSQASRRVVEALILGKEVTSGNLHQDYAALEARLRALLPHVRAQVGEPAPGQVRVEIEVDFQREP